MCTARALLVVRKFFFGQQFHFKHDIACISWPTDLENSLARPFLLLAVWVTLFFPAHTLPGGRLCARQELCLWFVKHFFDRILTLHIVVLMYVHGRPG